MIGISSRDGKQVVFTCEVITHLHGTIYSGNPDTSRWEEYGNEGYQYTLEKIWQSLLPTTHT